MNCISHIYARLTGSDAHLYDSLIEWTACTTDWIKFTLVWLPHWMNCVSHIHARLTGSSSHLYDSLIEWTACTTDWSSSHLYDSLIEWTACTTDWIKFTLVWLPHWMNCVSHIHAQLIGSSSHLYDSLTEWTAYPIYMHDWLDQVHTCMTPSLNELRIPYTCTTDWIKFTLLWLSYWINCIWNARLAGSSSHLYDSLIE